MTDRSLLESSLIEVAAQLLHEQGPEALSLRKVADLADTSTQAIYTHFGGKRGLIDALYFEGWERLYRRLQAVPEGDDILDYIVRLGDGYRANAYDNPHFYELMFGRGVPGFDPPARSRHEARSGFRLMHDAVQRAIDQGRLEGKADEIAHLLWAGGHGFVDLRLHELAWADDEDERVHRFIWAIFRNYGGSPASKGVCS